MMQPYSIFPPKSKPNGIVFNSPHSGTCLPEEFLQQISIDPVLLHYSGDVLVDRLIRNTPLFGATVFVNNYSRTYVDTNRSCHEIDPEMFHIPDQKNTFERTGKVRLGFGIFSRKSYQGQEIYRDKLPGAEINHRLDMIYRPVHHALGNLLDQCHQSHGFYLLLDCHSMPSYEFVNSGLSNTQQPDLIIGNCFNGSCRERVTQLVANYFTNHGLKVTYNIPYAGGFNTQTYGQPADNRNALQLEFSRALYMDEKTLKPHEGFSPLQSLLTGLSENLAGFFSSENSL
ncbi:MAG: N-formylglutamate amidohydrolase [Alphaproteobacteria bacterium]|nr:MAG: N-formylglutamate amidohydrolase [Alphaproteobacteria bacterium]